MDDVEQLTASVAETAIVAIPSFVLQWVRHGANARRGRVSTAEVEIEMEARIARLESDVAHIRTDVAEVKTDIRRLDAKIDAVKDVLIAVKDEIASTKVWALVLYIALAGGLFGALARGFGWF